MAEIDMELLLSMVKGLGSVMTDSQGNKVYCKDDDCLRKGHQRACTSCAEPAGEHGDASAEFCLYMQLA